LIDEILFLRQLIYDYPEQLFAERNVMAIEHADFEGVERLAQVLGKRKMKNLFFKICMIDCF
jgi:chaperonin GroEL (HSP60 family)